MRILLQKTIKKPFQLILGHMGWVSLVITTSFSPLSMAKENERLTQSRLTEIIKEAGLNKKITLAEYWKKTKKFYPAWLVPQMESYVKSNAHRVMPEVQISATKSSDGTVIPVLRLTDGGKSYTLQFFGEKNKYVKFNNVTLSEYDVARVDDAFTRIVASDYNLRLQAEKLYFKNPPSLNKSVNKTSQKDNKKANPVADFNFQKFPRMTPGLWKSLTKEQRVGFILKIRRTHQAAVAVLASQSKTKKTSSLDLELFYKTIFGEEANAQKAKRSNASSFSGQCVVAGYVATYAPGENDKGQRSSICNADLAIQDAHYGSAQSANQQCASENPKTIACNPLIYGYPQGKPFCVDKISSNFQQGTWFEGPCDSASRLTQTKVGDFSKPYSELSREEQKRLIEEEQRSDYKLTKDFLEGVLKSKDAVLLDAFQNGKWTHELDTELVKIQNQFETEIAHSMQICSTKLDVTGGKADEPRQKEACDQLHRRWLFADQFVSQIRSKGCLDGSKYIWDISNKKSTDKSNENVAFQKNKQQIEKTGSNLCECPNGKNVSFGERCDLSALTSQEISREPVANVLACSERNGNIKGIDEKNPCQCKDGSEPKAAKKGSFFSFVSDNGDSKVDNDERSCDSGGLLKWLLPIGIGIGILALIGSRDKDPKPVAPPVVPPTPPQPPQPPVVPQPPVIPPVVQPPAPVCSAPKIPSNGGCICGNVQECAANQRMMDYLTCQCGPATPSAPDITCPDGSSAKTLSACPTCPNGNYRTRMGCSEGGSGSNPNTGGAGGLPPSTAQ